MRVSLLPQPRYFRDKTLGRDIIALHHERSVLFAVSPGQVNPFTTDDTTCRQFTLVTALIWEDLVTDVM